jgi:tetratricopeptide (TPR) repeat protein
MVLAKAQTAPVIAARIESEVQALADTYEAAIELGLVEFEQQRLEEALAAFSTAQQLEPQLPIPAYNAAACHARLGDVEVAVQSLERALALQTALPSHAEGNSASIGAVEIMEDPDFDCLHGSSAFDQMVAAATRAETTEAGRAKTRVAVGWKRAKLGVKRDQFMKGGGDSASDKFTDLAGICAAEVEVEITKCMAAAEDARETKRREGRQRITAAGAGAGAGARARARAGPPPLFTGAAPAATNGLTTATGGTRSTRAA